MDKFILNNNIEIPAVGFGTYLVAPEVAAKTVEEAVGLGYRLFDGAAAYNNEAAVGEGLRHCGVARDELFVTSKVWTNMRGYDKTLKAFGQSLKDLGLDYLDLYLVHWPATSAQDPDWQRTNAETWRAMEHLLGTGDVRAIGVSNFMTRHLEPLLLSANETPAINQIEFNPGWQQPDTVNFCQSCNITVEAWSPLGRCRILEHKLLQTLAQKYNKTTAQICLRWEFQRHVITLPKSTHAERMHQNIDIFDFELTDTDMARINAIPPFGNSGLSPETVEF